MIGERGGGKVEKQLMRSLRSGREAVFSENTVHFDSTLRAEGLSVSTLLSPSGKLVKLLQPRKASLSRLEKSLSTRLLLAMKPTCQPSQAVLLQPEN